MKQSEKRNSSSSNDKNNRGKNREGLGRTQIQDAAMPDEVFYNKMAERDLEPPGKPGVLPP